MFGLLDSVKQALELKRSQDEENRLHNEDYGEKAANTIYSDVPVCVYELIFYFSLVLDAILEDQRKQGRNKSTSNKIKSLKYLQPQCRNLPNSQSHSSLASVKTSPGVQPLSVAGLSAPSYAQLFAHLSASNGQHHHVGAGRTDKSDHSGTFERERELGELANQEKLHRLRQEAADKKEASGIHQEPGQRTLKSEGDPYASIEEIDETEGLCAISKVVTERKLSKKHKSK